MVDVTLWGGWAGGHHLANVALHVANTLLLFLVLLSVTAEPGHPPQAPLPLANHGSNIWRSAFVAALFAVHPLHVESVAWIAERKDVLSTFFGLFALGAYVRYTRKPSSGKYLIVVCVFVLSLLAKPMWVTFPFLLLLIDIWPLGSFREQRSGNRRQIFVEKIPLLIIAAISSLIAIISQRRAGSVAGLTTVPVWARVTNAIVGYRMYLEKLILPVKLAVFYPHPGHWRFVNVIVSLIILSIITITAIVHRHRRPWLFVGWLWFLGTLVPVIGLVQIGMHSIADRYTYLPSVGVFIMIAWSIPLAVSPFAQRMIIAAMCLWLAGLTVCTWTQASSWQSSRTLFAHALKVTDGNFIAHQNLGSVLEGEGNLDGALGEYEEAARESPKYARIHENVGNILLKKGRYAEALTELNKSIALDPRSSTAFNSVGSIALINNRYEEAARDLNRAVELDPDNTAAHINYGFALLALGRYDEAIAQLAPITRAEPKRVLARTNLARAFAGRGDVDRAIRELQGVLQLAPDYAPAREALEQIQNARR